MTAPADYGQAQALVGQQTQAFSDLLNSQKAQQQGLFDQYGAASAAQPKLTDVLNTAQQQAGIGGLQDNINLFNTQATGVKGLIDRLNENTSTRTAGTNTNQAYLDRMRAVEGGGLNTQLSRLTSGLGDVTNAYNTANQNTAQKLSAAQADQATALHPLELQINAIGDRFARELTGFTTSKQSELNVLLDKLQAQQALNDREWQAAQALSTQANSYAQQAALIAQKAGADQANAQAGVNGSQMVKKSDGGYAFTNNYGNPISAAQYASAKGMPMQDLLQIMARGGDKGAATAAGFVGNDFGYDPTKVNNQGLADLYNSLVWGTGKSASVYNPSSQPKNSGIFNQVAGGPAFSLYKK